MHKKVGTITLEYNRGDGVVISNAFQGELINATFNGEIDVWDATFDGSFTAQAVNVVKNLQLSGSSVAVTTMTYIPTIGKGQGVDPNLGSDDGQWRDVAVHTFYVPPENFIGGWAYVSVQYLIDNNRHSQDKTLWPTKHQVLVNGELNYFTPYYTAYAFYYVGVKNFKHDKVIAINSPGYYTVRLQFAFGDADTNVYPYWEDVFIRVDYVKK